MAKLMQRLQIPNGVCGPWRLVNRTDNLGHLGIQEPGKMQTRTGSSMYDRKHCRALGIGKG